MPIGGLGNLIALPMQGQALKKANSAFVDEAWNIILDPWNLMASVFKNSKMDTKWTFWCAFY